MESPRKRLFPDLKVDKISSSNLRKEQACDRNTRRYLTECTVTTETRALGCVCKGQSEGHDEPLHFC